MKHIQCDVSMDDYMYLCRRVLTHQGVQDQVLSSLFKTFVDHVRKLDNELKPYYEPGRPIEDNANLIASLIRQCTYPDSAGDEC